MKFIEIFAGHEDYDRNCCVRVVLLGLTLEIGRGVSVGWYIACGLLTWGRWHFEWRWYADSIAVRLRAWWARCAWNADRLEDPFQ